MAKLYITEYPGIRAWYTNASAQMALAPPSATAAEQPPITITGTAAASAAFNANTTIIRLHTDAICSVLVGGTAPVATANDGRMAANQTEYFAVKPGDKLSVITNT